MLKRKQAQRYAKEASEERNRMQAERDAAYARMVARCKAAGAKVPPKPEPIPEVEVPADLPTQAAALMDTIASEMQPLRIHRSVDLMPAKRRVIPKGGIVNYDLSEEERVTQQPGAYMLAESRLKVTLQLHRPLYVRPPHMKPQPMLFERAAFCMRYNEPDLLCSVLEVVSATHTQHTQHTQHAHALVDARLVTPDQRGECQGGASWRVHARGAAVR